MIARLSGMTWLRPAPRPQRYELGTGARVDTSDLQLEQASRLARKCTRVLLSDGTLAPPDPASSHQVALRLAALPPEAQKQLERARLRIVVLDSEIPPRGGYPGKVLGSPDRWEEGLGAQYHYQRKEILMPRMYLETPFSGVGDSLLHELGHALSDAKVVDRGRIMSLDDDPRLLELFEAYRQRCGFKPPEPKPGGHDFNQPMLLELERQEEAWSLYAVTEPREYLAEGLSHLLSGGEKKEKLASQDGQLVEYLHDFLIAPTRGGSPFGLWDPRPERL